MPIPCSPEDFDRAAELLLTGEQTKVSPESLIETLTPTAPAIVMTRKKAGLLSGVRTQLGVFGDSFAFNVIQPSIRNNIEAENFVAGWYTKYKRALEPLVNTTWWERFRTGLLGIPQETDVALQKALRLTDVDGVYKGAPNLFSPEIIQSAHNIRRLYGELTSKHGLDPDTYFTYRDLLRGRPMGVVRDVSDDPGVVGWKGSLGETEKAFYEEVERKGIIAGTEETATNDFLEFLHKLSNYSIRRPFFDKVEKELVNPYFNVRFIKRPNGAIEPLADDDIGHHLWTEYKSHIFGSPTPLDRLVTYQFKKLGEMVGYKGEINTHDLYRMSQATTSLFYSGTLGLPIVGGRPGSVIRQMAQLVPTYAELGGKNLLMGMREAMRPGAIQALQDKNLLSSPIEQIIESVTAARGAGKVISSITESSLRLFSWADRFARGVTAYGKAAMFDDYMTRGTIEKLPMHRELKDVLLPLIKQGKLDEARDRFMLDGVVNLQYAYGKANRPAVFRGALGNLAGVFMSYPLNTAEMLRLFVKDALPESMGGAGNPIPLIRLIGLTSALTYAGSEFANVDLRSAFFIGAMPQSMAFPKVAADTIQIGRTNWEWATANVFSVGETDYHKKVRADANREFAKDLRSFVPGGIFVFEDLPKILDEGSIIRLLGATPKAEELNEAARRRARAAREARGSEGITGIK